MKKKVLVAGLMAVSTIAAMAQEKGRFEVQDLNGFKLHTYYTNDALGDASYIIESENGVVTLEQPLFKDNVAEYDAYLNKLGKKVVKRIADYHIGGTGDEPLVMAQGMDKFTKEGVYAAMMQGFAQSFGDKIVALPTGEVAEVAFGDTEKWVGITFTFTNGAATDFPAASILIGGEAYFTHWAPAKSHMNSLQLQSRASVDGELNETKEALASGAKVFIGGHGGAASKEAAEFKVAYLSKVKQLLSQHNNAVSFAQALKAAYPDLAGQDGVDDVAKNLYK